MNHFKLSLLSSSVLLLVACAAPQSETTTSVQPTNTPTPAPEMASLKRLEAVTADYAVLESAITVTPMMLESHAVLEQNTERYQKNEPNPIQKVSENPISTFSIDVDTGSYSNIRRWLNDGQLPPVDAVRLEEILNYFDYRYPQPTNGKPFALHTANYDSPWKKDAKLIKLAIQAQDIDVKELPPANLIFLIDVSGSMNSEQKLPLVKKTLRILTEKLRPQDKVTIITYASGEKLELEPTSGKEKDKILAVINRLQAQGSTSGEKAIN